MLNFTKIRQRGEELFHVGRKRHRRWTDGRTDRHDKANSLLFVIWRTRLKISWYFNLMRETRTHRRVRIFTFIICAPSVCVVSANCWLHFHFTLIIRQTYHSVWQQK